MSFRCTGLPGALGFAAAATAAVRSALRRLCRPPPRRGAALRRVVHRTAPRVEQVALAILLEDGAEHPAVAVEVGELRVLQLRVELGRAGAAARNSGSDHRPRDARCLPGLRISIATRSRPSDSRLRRRIHQLAVGFVVPPHVAEVGVHHVRAGVDVADHALAGRDRRREARAGSGGPARPSGSSGRVDWRHAHGCRTWRTAPSAPASGRWRRRRGTPCSRWSGSRRAGRWCRGS